MIQGEFDEIGQLFFEIELIADNGEIFSVNALLDTGSTERLAIHFQDLQGLEWQRLDRLSYYFQILIYPKVNTPDNISTTNFRVCNH